MSTIAPALPRCSAERHDWQPDGDTLILRDPQTHQPVGCQLNVACTVCHVDAVATWDLPQ